MKKLLLFGIITFLSLTFFSCNEVEESEMSVAVNSFSTTEIEYIYIKIGEIEIDSSDWKIFENLKAFEEIYWEIKEAKEDSVWKIKEAKEDSIWSLKENGLLSLSDWSKQKNSILSDWSKQKNSILSQWAESKDIKSVELGLTKEKVRIIKVCQ